MDGDEVGVVPLLVGFGIWQLLAVSYGETKRSWQRTTCFYCPSAQQKFCGHLFIQFAVILVGCP